MLINLFNTVKSSGVPCSLRELLDLIGALEARVTYSNMNDFYYLSRAILVKDESIMTNLIERLKSILKVWKN